MNAHRRRYIISAFLKETQRRNRALLCSGDTAQEVVTTHAVEAHHEGGAHTPGLQRVEQCLVHQPPVGVDGAHGNLVSKQGVDYVEEVLAY